MKLIPHPPYKTSSLFKSMLAATVTIAFSSATSSAALLLNFTEEGGNVIMRASGSVDTALATFVIDSTINTPKSYNAVNINHIGFFNEPVSHIHEVVEGDWLVLDDFANLTQGVVVSGTGFFNLFDSGRLYLEGHPSISDDSAHNNAVLSSNLVVSFAGATFVSMGLDERPRDVDIDLWEAARGTDDDAAKIRFRVSTVPEPSSTALLGLGGFALMLRRRR